ncbi:MAG: ROK family protein, partial [Nitrospirales bacterium]
MPPKQKTTKPSKSLITLAIDIGGSGIKGLLLDISGQPIAERIRVTTPQPAIPQQIIAAITKMAKGLGKFDRVSVGFPGVIQQGVVKTAPNLDPSWTGTRLVGQLERRLGKPVQAANDADVQGYG